MEIIETTAALETACQTLARSDFLAIDTEFIRETTFWPELCLVQMACDGFEAIVDPMAKTLDLAPFLALMADRSVVKVFHSARQDIEIIHHLGELVPQPLFDTQVAAMVCGFGDSVSYEQLAARTLGVAIDKSLRFADWRQRPLSDELCAYALADVTHLRSIYRRLKAQLHEAGRERWVDEEMAILESPATYDLPPEKAWTRLRLGSRNKPRDLAVARHVAAWREREARRRNVPRRRVLKDEAIREIAARRPADVAGLGRLRSIPNGWARSAAAAGLIEAVHEALAVSEDDLPRADRPVRPPDGAEAASDLLKVLLKTVAERHGVATKIIATGADLDRLAALGAGAGVAALSGWRRELFGEQALRLLGGETALRLENRRVAPVEL